MSTTELTRENVNGSLDGDERAPGRHDALAVIRENMVLYAQPGASREQEPDRLIASAHLVDLGGVRHRAAHHEQSA